ncbi:MAG: 50S ribosomal protein L29 [Candidatus Moranbacteria bacterium RIFCSPHIGHO2_01_FULL_55_24]|nr:MAG: 50S ribosomal protein L29 [Candidatus Moranbacteria bacterium RIFCSPHIGHO2_01_FULL_55_24]
MKAKEWIEKNTEERAKALVELLDKTRKLRFDLATREAKNHTEYRKMKKDIARLKTIARIEEVGLDETGK